MNKFFTWRAGIFSLIILFVILYAIFSLIKSQSPIVEEKIDEYPQEMVIGTSVLGREIKAYKYGQGERNLTFVGGIHGGYEWNSILLAYAFMDYLKENPQMIPTNISVTVIPSANPDGQYEVVGKNGRFTSSDVLPNLPSGTGRFNANKVDLNRNSACRWQPQSTWRKEIVSAGTEAFSEPEVRAIRDYALSNRPEAFIFWHSQSNAIYASECLEGILPETKTIMNKYSLASGYPANNTFTSYEITGDITDWLASVKIPAITVELSTHETIEWSQNLAGIKALFYYFGTEKK